MGDEGGGKVEGGEETRLRLVEGDGVEEEEGAEGTSEDVTEEEATSELEAGGVEEEESVEGGGASETAPPASVLHELWEHACQKYVSNRLSAGYKKNGVVKYKKIFKLLGESAKSRGWAPDEMQPQMLGPLNAFADTITNKIDRRIAFSIAKDIVAMSYMTDPKKGNGTPDAASGQQAPPPMVAPPAQQVVQPAVIRIETSGRGRARAVTDPEAPPRAPAKKDAFAGVLPKNDKIRVFKRSPTGKSIFIDDYTPDDLNGQALYKFLKESVDPTRGDPSGFTVYDVFRVDPNSDEPVGAPMSVNVEGEPRQTPEDPLSKVRETVDLIHELRDSEQSRDGQMKEVLDVLKVRAANPNAGPMDMMMMMSFMKMMEQPRTPGDEDKILKIFEKLRGPNPHEAAQLMPQLAPPPPPQPSELAPIVSKLLDVNFSREPTKPPPTLVEQVKDMQALREFFAPPQNGLGEIVAMFRQEMKDLREELKARTSPAAQTGLAGMLESFKELSNVVKTMAPVLKIGESTSFLKELLTPQVAGLMRDIFTSAMARVQQQPQMVQQLPTTPQPQQPVRPLPPPAAIQYSEHLKTATDERAQIQDVLGILQALYLDPVWQRELMPYIQAFMSGDMARAEVPVIDILQSTRPDLNKPEFRAKVLNLLVASLQGQVAEKRESGANAAPAAVEVPGQVVPPVPSAPAPAPAPAPAVPVGTNGLPPGVTVGGSAAGQ